MSIPSTFIDRLLSSINIVDVIGRRLTLVRKEQLPLRYMRKQVPIIALDVKSQEMQFIF